MNENLQESINFCPKIREKVSCAHPDDRPRVATGSDVESSVRGPILSSGEPLSDAVSGFVMFRSAFGK